MRKEGGKKKKSHHAISLSLHNTHQILGCSSLRITVLRANGRSTSVDILSLAPSLLWKRLLMSHRLKQ